MPLAVDPTKMLPQELIDEITSYLQIDRKSLVASSIVCRAWLTSCRRYLFAQVDLTRANTERLKDLVISNPTLTGHIRAIEIDFQYFKSPTAAVTNLPDESSWINSASCVIGKLRRLNRLSLRHVNWTKIDGPVKQYFCDQLVSVFASIIQLDLTRVIFPTQRDAEHFIEAFPSLQSVSFSTVAWPMNGGTATFLHLEPKNPPITSIRWLAGFKTTLVESLCKGPNVRLEFFQTHMLSFWEVSRVYKVLETNKESLREFSLHADPDASLEMDRVLETTELDLKLRSLTLGDIPCLALEREASEWLFTTIIALANYNLKALTLRLDFGDENELEEGFDWEELDRTIDTHPKLAGLASLTIITLHARQSDLQITEAQVMDVARRLMSNTVTRDNFVLRCQTASI